MAEVGFKDSILMYTTPRLNTELNQDITRTMFGLNTKPNQDKPAILPDIKPVLTLGQNKDYAKTKG